MKSKLTTGGHARPAATSRPTPIHALGVVSEGPRPSDPQRPICPHCGHNLDIHNPDIAERTCACGCGRSLQGRRAGTRYALTACRVRRHRKRYTSVTGPGRRGGPSGLQVSYAKAVRALIREYRLLNLPDADRRAVELVRGMLSDRQRARLDERRTG